MKRYVSLFAATMMLATGCVRNAAEPAAQAVRAPRPVAAIVAVRETFTSRTTAGFHWTPLPRVTIWRVPLSAEASAEKLPLEALADFPPRLSPDGSRLAYVPYRASAIDGPDRLQVVDLRSLDESGAGWANGLSFGWSRDGGLVTVSSSEISARSEIAVSSPGHVRKLVATDFPGVEILRFLAADGDVVYVSGFNGVHAVGGSSETIWRVPAEGAPIRLRELSMRMQSTEGERLLRDDWWPPASVAATAPLAAIGTHRSLFGAPDSQGGQQVTSGLTRVDFVSLPGMRALRSVVVTPPPGVRDDRYPVFDGHLERYLLTTWRDRVTDLWECGVLGDAQVVVSGKGLVRGPMPLGYVGDDFLYRSVESSRVVVRLYRRASGVARALADVGPADAHDAASYPQVTLLGFEYDR